MKAFNLLFLLGFCATFIEGANLTHYTAAVVEYHPIVGNVSANVDNFIFHIYEAKLKGADIVVFPEIGLNGRGVFTEEMITRVPEPADGEILCLSKLPQYSKALKRLSCSAFINQIYVVVNLAEFMDCSSGGNACPLESRIKYNTNVVFDRTGAVIARYRKHNLYGEPGMTSAPAVPTFFDTEFGVRFGTFICFDILFAKPALQLTRELGIRHIIFPTAWYHEVPFLNAIQAFSSWAYSQDITMLVAGYNAPENGTSGSGIFQGKSGAIISSQPDTYTSHVLVATIPKEPNNTSSTYVVQQPSAKRNNSSRRAKQIRQNLSAFETVLLENLEPSGNVCDTTFCCTFNVSYERHGSVGGYRAVAFSGVRDVNGIRTAGIQACALVSCGDKKLSSCGSEPVSAYEFTSIKISGRFKGENTNIMPSTLIVSENGELLPLYQPDFSLHSECMNQTCEITMEGSKNISNIVTFGIHSRVFASDGQKPSKPKSNAGCKIMINLIICLFNFMAVLQL